MLIMAIWDEKNRKYYENRGYTFTSYGEKFIVQQTDFSKSSKMNVVIKCDCCNNDIIIAFRSYYKNITQGKHTICNCCKSKKRLDKLHQRVVEICDQKQYKLLTRRDEILDTRSIIFYICKNHGVTQTKIRSLLEGKGCYQCGRDTASIKAVDTTLERRREKLYNDALIAAEKHGYVLLSNKEDIVSNVTYIKYACPLHGEHTMRVSNFISGKGCPDCVPENNSERFKLSADEVECRVLACHGHLLNKYDYKNNTTKNLLIECFECCEPFATSLRNFTQHGGQVCSNCSGAESLGERRIRMYLEDNDILFEPQKWFPDCRDKNPLPFDFYLPAHNVIIEFDGRQHFEETQYFTYSVDTVRKHDKIKNQYCLNNNIHLIRIPYWDYNKIDEILEKELISHKDIV